MEMIVKHILCKILVGKEFHALNIVWIKLKNNNTSGIPVSLFQSTEAKDI